MGITPAINALYEVKKEYEEKIRVRDEKIKELNEMIIKQGHEIEHYKLKLELKK